MGPGSARYLAPLSLSTIINILLGCFCSIINYNNYNLSARVILESKAEISTQLATRIGQGDAKAESELVERYSTGVKLILLKKTGNRQLAKDLSQDTFIIALKKLRAGEVRNPAALAAFLRQTAVNLSIEHFRKEKRYVHQESGIIALQTPHIDKKAEHVDRQHAGKLLATTIQELANSRDREILQRFYLLDEEKPQICAALELSAAHFDRVLYRAKQRMRKLIMESTELKSLLFGSLFDG